MTTQEIEEKLSDLWQEGSRDVAVAFFRRAIHGELTLAELAATLEFSAVKGELKNITMRQVLTLPQIETPTMQARPEVQKIAATSKGQRRDKRQTEKIKHVLLDALKSVGAGLSTPELSDMLQRKGFGIDTATANLILKNMEQTSLITGDMGRPRTWRLKNQGRQVPEPIVIRKAQDRTAEAVTPAAAPQAQVSLLSQAEIQSAAATLRERFFASKNNA